MGYYAGGDYYGAAGDLSSIFRGLRAGVTGSTGTSIVKAGGSALVRRFMPGVGTGLAVAKGAAKTIVKHMRKSPSRLERAIAGRGGRRYRRMNVCNPRALRRSLRRVKGFEHFARQVVRIVTPKKRVSGFHFRRKRKR